MACSTWLTNLMCSTEQPVQHRDLMGEDCGPQRLEAAFADFQPHLRFP